MESDEESTVVAPLLADIRFVNEFSSDELSATAVGLANAATIGRQEEGGKSRAADLLDATARILMEIVVSRDDSRRELRS